MLTEPRGQASGHGARLLGLGEHPNHDDPGRSGGEDLIKVVLVNTADRKPGPRRIQTRRVPNKVQPRRWPAGLGRRRPHGASAEVVGGWLDRGRRRFRLRVRRQPDDRLRPDELPGHADRQVILAKMQDISAAGIGDVGPVVHRQERAMLGAGFPEYLQIPQLLAGFQALLPELNDVHPVGKHGGEEARQVALALSSVGTEVQPRRSQPVAQLDVPVVSLIWHDSEASGSESQRLGPPVDLGATVLGQCLDRRAWQRVIGGEQPVQRLGLAEAAVK